MFISWIFSDKFFLLLLIIAPGNWAHFDVALHSESDHPKWFHEEERIHLITLVYPVIKNKVLLFCMGYFIYISCTSLTLVIFNCFSLLMPAFHMKAYYRFCLNTPFNWIVSFIDFHCIPNVMTRDLAATHNQINNYYDYCVVPQILLQ